MEHIIQLHIEHLPEGMYLATSDDVQGLVAQGRTVQETIEIARNVAKNFLSHNLHLMYLEGISWNGKKPKIDMNEARPKILGKTASDYVLEDRG